METPHTLAKSIDRSSAGTAVPLPASSLAWRPRMLPRVFMAIGGLALLVGFFMPWVQLGELATLTGLEVVISNNILLRDALPRPQRLLFLLAPLAGIVLLVLAVTGNRLARYAASFGGLLVLGLALLTALGMFVQLTHAGLWLVLAGAFVALLAGVLSANAPTLR